MADPTAMMIIVAMVVFMSLMIVGILIGMSVHREATRRRRGRLHRDEMTLARMRTDDIARGRYTRDDVRRESDRSNRV